jgi:TolA-binding protein
MQEGVALIQLKQYDEAARVIQDFLKTSPEKELAAAAEFGLATIYKDTNKTDQAIQTFRAVRDKYAGTEQAEQAAFWVGQMLSNKGDAKGAITELKSFIAKYPKSEMVPPAILTLGQAQSAADQKAAAIETFKELATKHPKAEVAPFAYFQQAGILQADQKYAEVQAVMKDFIAKYPDHERVYAAYDYIAQIQVVEKQPQEAIATYEEYATKYANHPHAAIAILKVSDQWKKMADAMGRYLAIPEPQRPEWRKAYENSVAAAEKILEKYPESAEVAPALQNLLAAQKQFVLAKIKADANVESYFDELARKFADKPATANKIKFTLAGYFSDKDKPKALEMMKKAYDPALIYAPADLDLYATALIEQKKYDEVQAVADKLAKDFPLPPHGDPTTLPRSITDPAALSLFLHAKVLQLTGKTAEAAAKFEQLKKTYPWSPKLLEADFGIATDFFQVQKYDDAIKLLGPVVRATTGPAEIRARGMMLMGQISEAKGDIDSAINNYIKIATFFEGVPELASEGLWRGAQLQEKKASGEVKQKPQATPVPAPAAAKTASAKKDGK